MNSLLPIEEWRDGVVQDDKSYYMELKVFRKAKMPEYTIGKLYIDEKYFSDVLEDTDRGLTQDMPLEEIKAKKIYGKTAIPTGTYEIDMNTVSPKFKDRSWAKPFGGKLPRLVNVPGYEGVLIHPLNQASESLGCIGVGKNSIKGMITDSSRTFMSLMSKHLLPAKLRGEKITLTIE